MKMEIQYLFLFCVLGEQMQSEEKFKGEISSKKIENAQKLYHKPFSNIYI